MAYVIPLLNSLMNREKRIDRKDGVKVLVVCSTRELCIQVNDVFQNLGKACVNVVSTALFGGQDIKSEKDRIRKGINVVVGTAGRINYHLENTQSFNLENIETVIFEECDRIIEMGFKKELN